MTNEINWQEGRLFRPGAEKVTSVVVEIPTEIDNTVNEDGLLPHQVQVIKRTHEWLKAQQAPSSILMPHNAGKTSHRPLIVNPLSGGRTRLFGATARYLYSLQKKDGAQ